jgi:WD40 repeat protein
MLSENSELLAFVRDANRFILEHRSIIENAPLQTYSSALMLSPRMSRIRIQSRGQIPRWIKRAPVVQENWSLSLQTLEGHSGWVHAVAFSPDGQLLTSTSDDGTVRL